MWCGLSGCYFGVEEVLEFFVISLWTSVIVVVGVG